MKAGRNDPCPCGSGKKYKKCCLGRDQEAEARRIAVIPPSPVAPPRSSPNLTHEHPISAAPALPPRGAEAPAPPRALDPGAERADIVWRKFESLSGETRFALFLETLDDTEVMTDDMAFEMLVELQSDAQKSGDRSRFAECIGALRERRPEVFDKSAHYYLSWCIQNARAEDRPEVVSALARELAPRAGRDVEAFSRAAAVLGYHGRLSDLVEALRIAWPGVKTSGDIFSWAIAEFAETGVAHEIFNYLEFTSSPDPADPVLLDRVRYFIEDPNEGVLRELLADLAGTSGREWQLSDFDLGSTQKKRRDEWDDAPREPEPPSQGAMNLTRLINEFTGYLRREEEVPFARGELVRQELYRYFLQRHKGELDPHPSMLEQAMHPGRKLPKPPKPAHPLCPERVTFDGYLGRMLGMMSSRHHSAAALFQAMPAWLRFLESRRLIGADIHKKVLANLYPLHSTMLQLWSNYTEDPLLYRQEQAWPGPAARD